MELYADVSHELSSRLTRRYSTSFSLSSLLFDTSLRRNIYTIYGLVRIADEIVDTYTGTDQRDILDRLESEVYDSMRRGYSANPIVHAFALTMSQYSIDRSLVKSFFTSMRMDIDNAYSADQYKEYIYGSAEVVGLMCLWVFCGGDAKEYRRLSPGARALGSAYQKVNFLRDLAEDYGRLGRMYFPGVTFETFDESEKRRIVSGIESEFRTARQYIVQLPRSSRRAVYMSYIYYTKLLEKIGSTPVEVLTHRRVRIAKAGKMWLFIATFFRTLFL